MRIIAEVVSKDEKLIKELLDIWDEAFKDAHGFLTNAQIEDIKECIPSAILQMPTLIIMEDTSGKKLAFMGIDGQKLEMLFVSERRQGIGKTLLKYAIERYNVDEVYVSEENYDAMRFYEKFGFKVCGKTRKNEDAGEPFALLHMRKID